MALINVLQHGELFFFEPKKDNSLIGILRKHYHSAHPIPHIVIDNFLPETFIEAIVKNFPNKEQASVYNTTQQQRFKRGYRPDTLKTNPSRSYLYLFNTAPFLQLLEDITGTHGLIPDPYFIGSGFHETESGGKLNIHTDFNFNQKLNLLRKLNVLIFLNKDWKIEYNGNFELWDSSLHNCIQSIAPIFNRCVIFQTSLDSPHGHPDPLCCPKHITRRSISLYYYLSPQGHHDTLKLQTNADWMKRPGYKDKITKQYKILSIVKKYIFTLKTKATNNKD